MGGSSFLEKSTGLFTPSHAMDFVHKNPWVIPAAAIGAAAFTGGGSLAALGAAGGGEAAASAPLVGAEIGAAGDAAAGAGAGSGLLGGTDALAAMGGAANELGATSSSIGAAGMPANPASVGFGNFMSTYGNPGLHALGQAQRGMAMGQQGLNLLGMGTQPTPQMPAARPPAGPAPIPASQILSPPGGSASIVGQAMGGGAPQGPGGISPQMLMLLQQLMQQQGVR